MKNLNKENYFTKEWLKKYPKASKVFCDWIDKYKSEVDWVNLFNGRALGLASIVAPKFHDIPIDMQRGIIARFFEEHMVLTPPQGDILIDTNHMFKVLEDKMTPHEEPSSTGSYLDSPDTCSSCGSPARNCIC